MQVGTKPMLDRRGFAPGVCVVRFTAGGAVQTQRVTVAR